jgi:hypothetical protein
MSNTIDERQKCQAIYRTLIDMSVMQRREERGVVFIRELQETARCDKFTDLWLLRDTLGIALGADRRTHVLLYTEDQEDRHLATSVVYRYRPYTISSLYRALDFKSRVWYHTVLRFDRFSDVVGSWFHKARN